MKRLLIIYILFCALFEIKANEQDAQNKSDIFNIDGSIGLNGGSYNSSGISPRDKDIRYSLTGAVNISLLGINFPFSAVVSEENSGFTQPSNQIGVSPNYKSLTLHGGWRSLNYSPFSLAGHTFLGGGIDFNPANLRLSAMYGRFNKGSGGGDSSHSYIPPTYDRRGFAIKLGYGSQMNFLDIILLKAKDDESSLDSNKYNINPEENMVIGLSTKLNPISSLFFEFDASASLYTNNIRAESMADSSIPNLISPLMSLFSYKTSSQLTTAFQTALAWRTNVFGIKVAYKRVEPDYKSMGAYYIESDVENILIAPNLNLFNRTLSLTGSIGLQRDNLLNTKLRESKRIITSAGLGFNKPEYGIDLKYSSYGVTQYKGLNPLIDSLKIARVNMSFNGSARISFQYDSLLNNFIIIGGYQTLNDLNAKTASTTESDNYMSNISYQGNLLNIGLNFGFNFNYVQSLTSSTKMEFFGPSAQIGKIIDKINIGMSFSYQFQKINSQGAGATAGLNLQGNYQINNHQSVNLNFNIINSGKIANISPAFTEYRSNIGYIYNF